MKTDESPRIDPAPIVLPELRSARRSVPKSLVERYHDIQFIGQGGMGTVYRAVDPRLDRKVALKLLKEADAELLRRFIGEARSQARIQHEHICRVYEAGQADGEPYIAMQYIEGEPLSKVRERLTLEQRVYLMKEVSLAVHEAHRIGMIHRDIKPSNILVEEREDGTKKPYVMDFGLARQVEDKGQTQTGAIVGTLAFMPPEQARGDVRAMDRRSDVYSLGATLYDVIAGRPPFVAEDSLSLLMMVGYGDAPSLGKVQKGVPEEIETIVMKCLEREPARRYDSARALAEDLRRFLDGEPILARRASFRYVLLKKVKKNKLFTALLAVLVLGSLAGAGVWAHEQRQAAARERLAQELGESVKEMELFLRAAYALPIHDVERERDVVRARLREIEQRMVSAGRVGEGPGHYAIGRGHLALGDPEQARAHLEQAIAAGYSSVDLEYALGRALGELFRRAVEETKRITNEEERSKRNAEIERSLLDPALAHLRAATGARIESPLYAEGLVALYQGKNEEAIAKARAAFEEAPWMYEVKKLEGDALFAEGSKYRHDAAFDYDRMKEYFEPAAEAYKVAAEMGSSDPEVYRAECELWEKTAYAKSAMGKPPDGDFDTADAACSRAVRSSSRDGAARVQRALTLQHRFFLANTTGKNVDAAQAAALEAVDEAVRSRPHDAMALYARASAFHVRVMRQASLGMPLSIAETIAAFQRVLEVDPRFTWALSELGQTYLIQAQIERLHGKDPHAALANATAQLERASQVDATFSVPAELSIRALCVQLGYETEHGLDAPGTVSALAKAVARLDALKLGGWKSVFWKARALRVRAAYELSIGEDPRARIAEGLSVIHAFTKPGAETSFLLREMVELRLIEAEYALRRGLSPAPDLRGERAAVQRELRSDGADVDTGVLLGRIEILTLRGRAKDDKLRDADFEGRIAPLEPLLSGERDDPRGYQVLAELHAEKGAWLEAHGKAPDAAVKAGLAMVEKVLGINPQSADALAVKGRLHLVAARAARGEERALALGKSKAALEAAFRENPRLGPEHVEALGSSRGPM